MLQIREVAPSELYPWEQNPRVNDHAVAAVAKSIESFGFNVPILCDQNMAIIAGHTWWKAARKLGLASVPVIQLEMTDTQRKAFAVADNKTAEIADWDVPKLRSILCELESQIDLKAIGFTSQELQRILDAEIEEDFVPPPPEQVAIRTGDVFRLGRHWLVCGDATDQNVITKLLDGQQIDMVITSPPRFNNKGLGDWLSYEEYCRDMKRIVDGVAERLVEGGVVFWTAGNTSTVKASLTGLWVRLFEKAGLDFLESIAWVKPGASFSLKRQSHIWRNSLYYPAHQWDPLLVYRKPGSLKRMTRSSRDYMLDHQTDVWEIGNVTNPMTTCGHPTVAPVEIPYRAMQAYGGDHDVVVDPFAGSGTTLIAVEKCDSEKTAFLVEINPIFCQIIINRWENFTGGTAQLVDAN